MFNLKIVNRKMVKFALKFQEQEVTFHVHLLGVDQVLTSEEIS